MEFFDYCAAVLAQDKVLTVSGLNELEIGRRLREFREGTRIPRTAFALSIGIGSERLASYESGRVPLRYGVFKSIAERYRLNPTWLATGQGESASDLLFELENIPPVRPSAVFSQVYESTLRPALQKAEQFDLTYLTQRLSDGPKNAVAMWWGDMGKTFFLARVLDSIEKAFKKCPESLQGEFLKCILIAANAFRDDVSNQVSSKEPRAQLAESPKKVLTDITESAKYLPVKSPMANLLDRLNKATNQRGMKSKLAKVMGVPLANISQWLSGEREPGGETTLRLLKWVEQQEPSP